ncbi:hypothetical protein [Maridesulfovibrio sp.]|uniref:hypothetical protein n=1 Tax=Maridesulfovibrio sp. TaxID=2795000 RepID=UPI002A18ABE2|nr:hypothetical protein [Maridesulfovibrio sp.]
MNSDNKAITPAEFPLALFMLGMPLILAAYSLSGVVAPANLESMLITGLAVTGFLAEPFRNDRHHDLPLWFCVGIPALLITWISFCSFARFVQPAVDILPYLLEARPLFHLLVCLLWITMFGLPTPGQISFWACCLALLVCAEFSYSFFGQGIALEPCLFGKCPITGPALTAGLCATLCNKDENRLARFIILAGIFCSLNRDYSLAAVAVLLLFGPGGMLKKSFLVMLLLFFTYVSLIPQDMTLLNRNDLPVYWVWFSSLELLARNPALMIAGFPIDVPLPLNIPTSLWNIWHAQHYVWTNLGLYVFHISPFWLHMLLTWGIGGVALSAAGAAFLYRRYSSDMMAALLITAAMGGIFSPLFFAPASAIVLIMAFACATRPEVRSFKFE